MGKTVMLNPGDRFGMWTVLERDGSNKDHRALWKCKCDCGTVKTVVGRDLRIGKSKSCGCKHNYKQPHYKDLSGQVFGQLTVLEPTISNNRGLKQWICICSCGNKTIASSNDLQSGHISSCGCLRSKGEQKILKILNENNIPFEKEKQFDTCISKNKKARFDFFVNNQYLIEYDGIQHYQEASGTWTKLSDIQERDFNKNQWCIKNNIPLIRIPYWHFDNLVLSDLLLETSPFLMQDTKKEE